MYRLEGAVLRSLRIRRSVDFWDQLQFVMKRYFPTWVLRLVDWSTCSSEFRHGNT